MTNAIYILDGSKPRQSDNADLQSLYRVLVCKMKFHVQGVIHSKQIIVSCHANYDLHLGCYSLLRTVLWSLTSQCSKYAVTTIIEKSKTISMFE